MSIVANPPSGPFGIPPGPVRRFSVDEYHRMIEAGVLTENDTSELLEGWIVLKIAHNPHHDFAVDKGNELLTALLPSPWRVRVQSAITTSDSEPEPDLCVALGPALRYRDRHPGPNDIAILIEIANTTLAFDRTAKSRMFARAGIACYWIVNLIDRQVEVYTDPAGGAFASRKDFRDGDLVPVTIAGQTPGHIAVSELLG